MVRTVDERGRGLAEVAGADADAGGGRLRVPGVLAGERVRARYRRMGRTAEGELVEVLAPAPGRTPPRCAHFPACGGCDWQHLAPEAQLRDKQARLLAALAGAGVVPERTDPPIRGPAYGYRRKARLGVRFVPGKGGALVGFREKRGNRVAVIESCAVLHPALGARIRALRDLVGSLDARARIAQIEAAAGDAEAVLVFRHLEPLGAADLGRLRRFADATGLGVALQPGGPDSLTPLAGPFELSYTLPGPGLELRFGPLDFVQVNAEVNAALVARAVAELRPAGRVLDLFCGIGNFTLALAAAAAAARAADGSAGAARTEVAGVEGDPRLVERARANARRNGLEGFARFHAADLARPQALAPLLAEGVDRLLLDPPRTGAEEALDALAAAPRLPERIVYVSCHPATLARDLARLVHGLGYRPRAVAAADMFAHTSHVEAIATLERAAA